MIVGLDSPRTLLGDLGDEILELRVRDDGASVLSALRRRGIASSDAFTIGSTLTVPLHDQSAQRAIAGLDDIALAASGVTVRAPTLDDVYLRLTGASISEAA
jgi:hypothetical protein